MKHTSENPYIHHEQILLLLPWYLNATLEESERNAVEQHLKVCLLCKREFVSLQNLATAVKKPNHLDSAAKASFQHLKNRLHAQEQPILQPSAPTSTAVPRQNWYLNLSLPALACAAALAFVLILPDRTPDQRAINADFRTLSNGEKTASPNKGLRVIFKEHTAKTTIAEILNSIHGRIVQGPDEQGLYQIGFDKTVAQKEILERVERLRTDTHVLFAEPAYALLSTPSVGH